MAKTITDDGGRGVVRIEDQAGGDPPAGLEANTRKMTDHRRISRRQLLRGALISGAGVAAAAVVGCGDDNDSAAPQIPTSTPSPSGTPGVITTTPAPTLAAPR